MMSQRWQTANDKTDLGNSHPWPLTQRTMDFLHGAYWIQAQQHQEMVMPFLPKQCVHVHM